MKNSIREIIKKEVINLKMRYLSEKINMYADSLNYEIVKDSENVINRPFFEIGEARIETEEYIISSMKKVLPMTFEYYKDVNGYFKFYVEPIYLIKDDRFTTHYQALIVEVVSKETGHKINLCSTKAISLKENAKATGGFVINFNSEFDIEEMNGLSEFNFPSEYKPKPIYKSIIKKNKNLNIN